MKLSTVISISAFSVAIHGHPLARRNVGQSNKNCVNKPTTAGAVYFITNQPDGNFIVGSDIGEDGKVTPRDAIWAGGRGSHGVADPLGPDPLFSQGAIKVSGSNVFTINAGSNTVTMFAIDPQEPAKLRMVGMPVSTGGEFPVSLAISKQSGHACVLNGGKVNGINCFKQDKNVGLIQLDNTQRSLNLNQTTPPSGPPNTVSHVVFSEDGTRLFASVKGVPPTPGFIASWDVDAKTGALSANFEKSVPAAGGLLPFGMSVIPGKDAILATDPGLGFDVFDFKNKKQATSTAVAVSGQKAVCWTSFSPKTGNFYLTDVGTSVITEVNVDNNLNAKIVQQYPQANGSATIDNEILTINNKDFMYVMAAGSQSILAFALDAPGKARPIQQLKFADIVSQAGLKTDANNLQGMTGFVGV